MPVGLDRVKAGLQTGVAQANWVSGSRVGPGARFQATPPPLPPEPPQRPEDDKGKQLEGGGTAPHPSPSAHRPGLMTAASRLGLGILQAWTFWGLCSDGSTVFPGLAGGG